MRKIQGYMTTFYKHFHESKVYQAMELLLIPVDGRIESKGLQLRQDKDKVDTFLTETELAEWTSKILR